MALPRIRPRRMSRRALRPSATTTDGKLELGLTVGGIYRWQAAPGEEWGQLGNTASLGESILSNFTGGGNGAVSSHTIYEPF
jgi:hypothetical protein